jgi:hypothetical protein
MQGNASNRKSNSKSNRRSFDFLRCASVAQDDRLLVGAQDDNILVIQP